MNVKFIKCKNLKLKDKLVFYYKYDKIYYINCYLDKIIDNLLFLKITDNDLPDLVKMMFKEGVIVLTKHEVDDGTYVLRYAL